MNRKNQISYAIVGATGIVGIEIARLLIERDLAEPRNIILVASQKSVGEKIPNITKKLENHRCISIEDALTLSPMFVLMSAGEDVSKEWAKKFTKSGAVVIDNSSAWRKKPDVPLVVPTITQWDKESKLISVPNCVAVMLSIALRNILLDNRVESIYADVYQSVSGAGKDGVTALEIENATNKYWHGSPFDGKIANNILPLPGEEKKVTFEIPKIFNERNTQNIIATCNRVPINRGHSANVRITGKFELKDLIQNITNSYNVVYTSKQRGPSETIGKELVFVTNIRERPDGSFNLFVTSDNALVGAASILVDILQEII